MFATAGLKCVLPTISRPFRKVICSDSTSFVYTRSWQKPILIINQSREFSTTNKVEEDKQSSSSSSNRALFKSTPVIPSILSYIEKVGVGMRPKRNKLNRRKRRGGGNNDIQSTKKATSRSSNDTLDEIEEFDYFVENESMHRMNQRRNTNKIHDNMGSMKDKKRSKISNKTTSAHTNRVETDAASEKNRGAYWLPPPPFSSFTRGNSIGGSSTTNKDDNSSSQDRKIVRRPVKLLGSASSLSDSLPRESKISEVAIAGRSNVGKSTLLNALLYGNIDTDLSPRQYQRGRTPERIKLPKGVKAITSHKPGETKELSFYQLTADIISTTDDESKSSEVAKMSLLLVDLPGYGFAYAKEERTIEWKNLMHHYLLERNSLKRILLLIDARHGFKKSDFEFLGDLQDGLLAKSDGDGNKVCDCGTLWL